jgi:CRP/FNR family cyclic AMP-dependent transcriptional regulator
MTESSPFAKILSVNPLFAGLGDEAIRSIASLCVTRRLEVNEVLFQKGDAGDALYAVRRGKIRIATGTDAGRRLTLNILGSGDVFGEIALLDGQSRTADASAIEPTELFMVQRRAFLSFLERTPRVAIRLIELLCERGRWMTGQMEERALLPLEARLARRLLMLANDYGSDLRISQDELALFVGGARESINRQLQSWKRSGLISLGRSRICLLDVDRLTERSQGEAL